MVRSTAFTSNRTQAVRLPKAVAFPEGVHQVEIIKLGNSRLITPVGRRWDELFAAIGSRRALCIFSDPPPRLLLLTPT
jgi:virulence-associated protein VagC